MNEGRDDGRLIRKQPLIANILYHPTLLLQPDEQKERKKKETDRTQMAWDAHREWLFAGTRSCNYHGISLLAFQPQSDC